MKLNCLIKIEILLKKVALIKMGIRDQHLILLFLLFGLMVPR